MLDHKAFFSIPNCLNVEGHKLQVIVTDRKPISWKSGETGYLSSSRRPKQLSGRVCYFCFTCNGYASVWDSCGKTPRLGLFWGLHFPKSLCPSLMRLSRRKSGNGKLEEGSVRQETSVPGNLQVWRYAQPPLLCKFWRAMARLVTLIKSGNSKTLSPQFWKYRETTERFFEVKTFKTGLKSTTSWHVGHHIWLNL